MLHIQRMRTISRGYYPITWITEETCSKLINTPLLIFFLSLAFHWSTWLIRSKRRSKIVHITSNVKLKSFLISILASIQYPPADHENSQNSAFPTEKILYSHQSYTILSKAQNKTVLKNIHKFIIQDSFTHRVKKHWYKNLHNLNTFFLYVLSFSKFVKN